MKGRRLILAGAALLLVGALFFFLFAPRTAEAEILVVEREAAVRALAVNGRIRPRQAVEVRPPVAGTLIALPFDVGDRVGAGTVIARIDDGPQRAAIGEAQAAAEAQEAVVEQARRDLARYQALGEFVTRQRVEQARLAVEQGVRDLQRLRASAAQAREVQQRYVVEAPFSGVITERPVDPGQTVGTEAILYRLANLDSPEIMAEVDETYAADLRPGTLGLVELSGTDRRLRARIVHVEPRVDETTGAREIRLRFIDSIDSAPAGLTVTINLIVERREDAISIPRGAILDPDSNARVRIVGQDGLVSERPIRFLDWPAAQVIVTAGLKPGDRLLADPAAAEPGERVKAAR